MRSKVLERVLANTYRKVNYSVDSYTKLLISDVSDSFNIGIGKYILYNFFDLPLPIEITEIDGDKFEFESQYSPGNRHDWEDKFIGTEMEGLVYDPHGTYFEKSEIKKVDGNKIYLFAN